MDRASKAKSESLRTHRTHHAHPERVRDRLFLTNSFFDPKDLLQVRYEMVRRVEVEYQAIARTAADFGVSRPTFYAAQGRFRDGGLQALVPHRSGPKGSWKVRPEVLRFVEELRAKEGPLPYRELARRVQAHMGLHVNASSLYRALGRREKKRRPSRRSRQSDRPRRRR